jgi:ABC-type Na+ efflux pump permease subunit
MMRGRMLYHLARADFLERVRRYSFLLTLAFAVGLAFLAYTGTISLELGEYRGVYNSAWVGSMMALVTSTFITLAGFYMVKNTIQRDRQTRVGLVLATTPMSKSLYTLGKALSNFAVLALMVAVLAAAAAILQLARAESGSLEPGKLLAPFIWVALPAAWAM